MTTHCAAACRSCEQFSFPLRCKEFSSIDTKWDGIWTLPGHLNATFTRIAEEFNATILSRETPWILVIDNFLTQSECQHLIAMGRDRGYERSGETSKQNVMKLTTASRTSTNAWCYEPCYSHPTTQQILQRLEHLTNVPDTNAEYLQLLKYEPGQFYARHSDVIIRDKDRAPGLRIMTAFLYLNDVEEGGETSFPNLGLSVIPKQGRVVLWPNVLNGFLTTADPRTEHEAQPVVKGTKYAANIWIHNRDFKTPHRKKCIWDPATTKVATNEEYAQGTDDEL